MNINDNSCWASMPNLRKAQGFTLAEVLITLVIIGIIAAITVPTLNQKTKKEEYVVRLKKAYSTLSQATNMIIAEEGTPNASKGGWASSSENIYKLFKKHLVMAKDCDDSSGCFADGYYKTLAGDNWNNLENAAYIPQKRLVLADGVAIMFDDTIYPECNGNWGGGSDGCEMIRIDINGHKKPNKFGRDHFWFIIKEKGLYPCGCENNSSDCIKEDGSLGKGTTCACKVLREGAMNY